MDVLVCGVFRSIRMVGQVARRVLIRFYGRYRCAGHYERREIGDREAGCVTLEETRRYLHGTNLINPLSGDAGAFWPREIQRNSSTFGGGIFKEINNDNDIVADFAIDARFRLGAPIGLPSSLYLT